MMPYVLLANAVLIVHLLFVLFVVFGAFLVLRWPRLAWIHVPAGLWGVAIEYIGFVCPLTPLEVALRRRGGEAGYAGGCITHYVSVLLYPAGLTRGWQLVLGTLALAFNVFIYWRLLAGRNRRPTG